MDLFLNVLIVVSLLAVLVTLGLGIHALFRGGDPERSNRLMRQRVMLQAVAILVLLVALWWKQQHAG